MANKEIQKYWKDATRGGYNGKGYLTREMMERDSIGHLIEETKPKPRRVINRTTNHMLRRPR